MGVSRTGSLSCQISNLLAIAVGPKPNNVLVCDCRAAEAIQVALVHETKRYAENPQERSSGEKLPRNRRNMQRNFVEIFCRSRPSISRGNGCKKFTKSSTNPRVHEIRVFYFSLLQVWELGDQQNKACDCALEYRPCQDSWSHCGSHCEF